MKVKALMFSVYANPSYRKCAAGGISQFEDTCFLLDEHGPFDVEDDDPRLFSVQPNAFGSAILVPVNPDADGKVGPMFGGSFGHSSDARFSRAIERVLGHDFYGAVPIHDRYETQEQYAALSR